MEANTTGESNFKLRPNIIGSILLVAAAVVGIGLTYSGNDMMFIVKVAGGVILAAVFCSVLTDILYGLRNALRLDVLALLAFYFLVYFEFLFPQTRFELQADYDNTMTAIRVTCYGLMGLAIGRNLSLGDTLRNLPITRLKLTKQSLMAIYILCFVLAYLHMWLAVSFNLIEWLDYASHARFSQPWGRSKYGNISSLLTELRLFGSILPPLAGLIYAEAKIYNKASIAIVTIILVINYYFAICSGTRNIFAVQIAGLFAGYIIKQHKISWKRLAITSAIAALLFVFISERMLEFRTIGLKRYIQEGYYKAEYRQLVDAYATYQNQGDTYFVDYNLYNISLLVNVFPDVYDYLGWNLPFVAATKPIPRAFWQSKPVDLKVGLEEAIGAVGLTISATFAGEGYVCYGYVGALLFGLFIGAFCGIWNGFGGNITSVYPLLLYASGFPPAIGAMRSIMFFTTALLPAMAVVAFGIIILQSRER